MRVRAAGDQTTRFIEFSAIHPVASYSSGCQQTPVWFLLFSVK
jgi:hypothetical protein